nr:hypothetical protein [Halomonas sp. UBA3074]
MPSNERQGNRQDKHQSDGETAAFFTAIPAIPAATVATVIVATTIIITTMARGAAAFGGG